MVDGMRRVYDRFGVMVSLRQIIEAQATLGVLAYDIETELARRAKSDSKAKPSPQSDPYEAVRLPSQKRHIAFLSRYLANAGAAYNESSRLRWEGPLNITTLEEAASAICKRHEALRLALSPDKDEFQLLELINPVRVTEVSAQMSLAFIAEIINQPFNPGDPYFRLELLQLEKESYELIFVSHALVMGQATLSQIRNEILSDYEARLSVGEPFVGGRRLQRPTAPSAAAAREARQFWRTRLRVAPARLEFATDKGRPPVKLYEGARLERTIPADLQRAAAFFAAAGDLSKAELLEATFALWLHRLTQQTEALIGVNAVPGHHEPELVGVLSQYAPEIAFAEWVHSFSAEAAASRHNRAVTASELIDILDRPRDQSRSGPFSAAIRCWSETPLPPLTGVRAELEPLPIAVARYDIELQYVEGEQGDRLYCDFSTDIFAEETIAAWLDSFFALLRAGVAQGDRAVHQLPMLSDTSRQLMLVDWNNTQRDVPTNQTVYSHIQNQMALRADEIALIAGDETLTYGEMGQRVEYIASRLMAGGVVAGDHVAVLLPRQLALLPAMLAIWRIGAAYVPLDPAFPSERLQYMLADSGAKAVLVSEATHDLISGLTTINVDELVAGPELAAYMPSPEQVAYLIYTSGSTGRPKGVVVNQANLLNYMLGVQEHLALTPADHVYALTTISFDIAVNELFLPLMFGAKVTVAAAGIAADGLALAADLAAVQPTFVQATPTAWKTLITTGWQGNQSLRMAALGEKLERPLAEALLSGNGRLWNLYGPTEATVTVTGVEIKSAPDDMITIGRPLANTAVYILDENLQPVPVGVVGELFVGGANVTQGYWQRPELTTAAFVPDPFAVNGKLYRTGDLAKYLPTGEILCLGRRDHQIKIHGVRIEPGEVEAAFLTLPEIADAVVVDWLDHLGDRQLVAHIVPSNGELDAAALRQSVRRLLPDVMVPPHILFADALPQTASGKVNRRALPEPGDSQLAQGPERVAPQTPTEKLLAEAWAKVLDIDVHTIGRHAHFFDLGGHSLSMTPMMLEVRKVFHVNLRLYEFFDVLTLHDFAELIDIRRRRRNDGANRATIVPDRRSDDYARQRMAYLRQEAELPATIAPARGQFYRSGASYENVLMTGATGFLGVYIVAEILQTTGANLYCLVRPRKDTNPKQRIEQQMRHYAVWPDTPTWQSMWASRVHVIEGDVTLPLLGMPDRLYEQMTHKIDAILHSAAHVNFIYPYEALRATNVLGLHEIVRFAFQSRIKPVHHLSTAAIWPMGAHLTFYEKDSIEHNQRLNLGYDEAKWVGEQVLLNAAERGLPVARYRPGEVGGDSVTGRCVTDHFVFASIKGFLQFGAFPTLDIEVDIAPVDYVAKALVFLMFKRNALGRAYHLTNPQRRHMSDALTFLRSLGYRFDEMRFETLRNQLVNRDGFVHNALFAYQSVLEEMDDVSLQLPTYDTRQTDRLLRGSGISCAPADEKLFGTYINYLREIGYLMEPDEQNRLILALSR